MNKQEAFSYYASQLEGIRESGVLKAERIITTPQHGKEGLIIPELLEGRQKAVLGLLHHQNVFKLGRNGGLHQAILKVEVTVGRVPPGIQVRVEVRILTGHSRRQQGAGIITG